MSVTVTPLQMSALRVLTVEVRQDATSYVLRPGGHGYVEVDVYAAPASPSEPDRLFIYEISPDGAFSLMAKSS